MLRAAKRLERKSADRRGSSWTNEWQTQIGQHADNSLEDRIWYIGHMCLKAPIIGGEVFTGKSAGWNKDARNEEKEGTAVIAIIARAATTQGVG